MITSEIKLNNHQAKIIDDIVMLAPNDDIVIKVDKNNELPLHLEAGCVLEMASKKITILIKENCLNEFTITHELLHIYFIKMGFTSRIMMSKNIGKHTEIIASRLNDILIHKLIYAEQIKRGIDISKTMRIDAESISKYQKETGFIERDYMNILTFIEDEYCDNIYRSLYIENIMENHKKSYAAAKRILSIYTNNDTSTPFGVRRTLIKVFKEFEKIVSEYGASPLDLRTLVCVPAIFRKEQFNQLASSVFVFKEDSIIENEQDKYSTLHSISDGQCCSIIDPVYNAKIRNELNVCTLDKFLYLFELEHGLRK